MTSSEEKQNFSQFLHLTRISARRCDPRQAIVKGNSGEVAPRSARDHLTSSPRIIIGAIVTSSVDQVTDYRNVDHQYRDLDRSWMAIDFIDFNRDQ